MPSTPTPSPARPLSTLIVRWILALALLLPGLASCRQREAGADGAAVPAANDATRPSATTTQKFELDGLHVLASFPGFRLLVKQSDPSAGMLAFAQERPNADRTASLFLDGSRSVTMPKSPADALASVLADDVCRVTGDCTELSRASLPNDGLLISVRKPHAVYTEVWRRNAQQRVVRCGAELSELVTSNSTDRRWLHEGDAVRAARAMCESLCRSVVPLP